ncbi:MAG: Mfa1 family fimbria major subunit [Tannerellaceae bacterium]|nr:Mfa1 family fimbria major subunit [Tannerellaceae bacterium]
MKANYLFPMLIVLLMFSSCSDDNKDGPLGQTSKEDAKMKLSLTLPPLASPAASSAPGTRAPIEGTDAENKISQVHIFVFDQAGQLPDDQSKGRFGPLDLNDTDQFTVSGNTYTMVEELKTTSGLKTIYVIANMGENEISLYADETQLLERIENVHKSGTGTGGLIEYTDATPPALNAIVFAGSETADLKSVSSGTPNSPVGVNIERTVSRVITTSPASFAVRWGSTTTDDMTVTISKYFIAQDAYKSTVGQNYFDAPNDDRKKTLISGADQNDWGDIINLYDPDDYIGTGAADLDEKYVDIVPNPATEAARVALPGFYIGENATNTPDKVAQHGNTTYAWIQTQIALTNTAVVNAAGDAIEYTGPALTAGTVFHLIRVRGVRDYITTAANATAVYNYLNAAERYEGSVSNFPYPGGNLYYRVFLNQTGTTASPITADDKYNVYRNMFVHLDVTAVNVNPNDPGGFGGGYPGDPNDPNVPIDPFTPNEDPDNPVNPNPHSPEEPIDEDEATLQVNITVEPWTYSPNGVVLQ